MVGDMQKKLPSSRRLLLAVALVACSISGRSASAAPAWYGANGGFVANTNNPAVAAAQPTMPDFFQHEYWAPVIKNGTNPNNRFNNVSSNGWETQNVVANNIGFGWCGFTSFTDMFYDVASQGYTFQNLADPTPAGGGWFAATYGPANNITATSSNITKVAKFFATNGQGGPQTTLQTFLNQNVNNNPANNGMARMISQTYQVNQFTGNVMYYSYAAGGYVSTNSGVVRFTNTQLKSGADLAYQLFASQQVSQQNQLWWSGHVVAVSGINTANNTVFVADPDSNPNPNPPPVAPGPGFTWPFPGTIPPGLATAPGAPLPVPAAPNAAVAASFNSNYDDYQFNKSVVSSVQAPQFTNTVLSSIYKIGPSAVKNINVAPRVKPNAIAAAVGTVTPAAAPTEDETDITLQIPSDFNPIDEIIIEPSAPVVAPSSDPTADSLTDDSDPSSTWTDIEDTTDPFGNALTDDAIQYDLSSLDPLEPGQTADVDLATTADFSTEGYDILLHFQGDPSDEWLPEMIAGTDFDPSPIPLDDAEVPEPASLSLLILGGFALGTRRRNRLHPKTSR
jgi:hypothetical protein